MALILKYGADRGFWEGIDRQEILAERRLNLLAFEYGYKYRLDISPKKGLSRIEFVRTLREARFIGMRIRRSGGVVDFLKVNIDGSLKHHRW